MNNPDSLAAQAPAGLNHLVIRVRDLAESHAFWTECLGFTHTATSAPDPNAPRHQPTRFYSGRRGGNLSHHDIALVEDPTLGTGPEAGLAIDHIAVDYADRETWSNQLDFLEHRNVPVSRRIRRGTMYSARVTDPNGYTIELVCDLPREEWESDIDAAINRKPVALV